MKKEFNRKETKLKISIQYIDGDREVFERIVEYVNKNIGICGDGDENNDEEIWLRRTQESEKIQGNLDEITFFNDFVECYPSENF